MKDDDLCEKWTRTGLAASEKRVLVTELVGGAAEIVYARLDIKKIAQGTGALMTIDGSDDDKIKPQGLDLHSFCDEDANRPHQGIKLGRQQP